MMKRRQINQQNGGISRSIRAPMLSRTAASPPNNNKTVYFAPRRHVSKGRSYICSVLLAILLLYGMSSLVQKFQSSSKHQGAQEQKLPRSSTLSSLFPREPKLTPGCSVKFQHTNMSLCYFLPYGANFGDELGPAAVKRLLEYHFECTADDVHVIDMASANPGKLRENRTCLFALGSIFHYTRAGDHVWGTGINPTHQGGHPDWLHIHSVRGPETARKMEEWYKMTKVPQGDPGKSLLRGVLWLSRLRLSHLTLSPRTRQGFLIPSLYQDYYHLRTKSIGIEPAYTKPQFCFVPHAQDLTLDFIQNPPPDLKIISVKQHWRPMMEAIRMCDYVVSTSLHGIVVADALGIPCKWFQFTNSTTQKTEGNFKYHDYLWSVGRDTQDPDRTATMATIKRTSSYMGPIPVEKRREIVKQFMSSFPYQIFRKSLTPLETDKRGFRLSSQL